MQDRRMRERVRSAYCLLILWICFLLRGIFYCTALPLWEGFDEWAHFAVAQNISINARLLTDRNSRISQEIEASLAVAPLPRGMTLIIPPGMNKEQYSSLPQNEQTRRETQLQHLSPQLANDPSVNGMPAYESSQPPLYYWILACPLYLLKGS